MDSDSTSSITEEEHQENLAAVELDCEEQFDALDDSIIENEFSDIHCVECNQTHCTMWRRLTSDKLICNLCHLKRVKNAGINGKSFNGNKKEQQTVRMSSRKNKAKKKIGNGFISLIKTSSAKNRRNVYKKKPTKGADSYDSIVTCQAVYHNGLLYQVGDILSVCDIEGGIYFAQARGFMQDDYCDKMVVITWLIPTVANPTHFDPMFFVPGIAEETARPMECFDFVCRAPTNFFKSNTSHPPFLKQQTDVNNLIEVAQKLKPENDITEKTEE